MAEKEKIIIEFTCPNCGFRVAKMQGRSLVFAHRECLRCGKPQDIDQLGLPPAECRTAYQEGIKAGIDITTKKHRDN